MKVGSRLKTKHRPRSTAKVGNARQTVLGGASFSDDPPSQAALEHAGFVPERRRADSASGSGSDSESATESGSDDDVRISFATTERRSSDDEGGRVAAAGSGRLPAPLAVTRWEMRQVPFEVQFTAAELGSLTDNVSWKPNEAMLTNFMQPGWVVGKVSVEFVASTFYGPLCFNVRCPAPPPVEAGRGAKPREMFARECYSGGGDAPACTAVLWPRRSMAYVDLRVRPEAPEPPEAPGLLARYAGTNDMSVLMKYERRRDKRFELAPTHPFVAFWRQEIDRRVALQSRSLANPASRDALYASVSATYFKERNGRVFVKEARFLETLALFEEDGMRDLLAETLVRELRVDVWRYGGQSITDAHDDPWLRMHYEAASPAFASGPENDRSKLLSSGFASLRFSVHGYLNVEVGVA
jgi:hypothetical protein